MNFLSTFEWGESLPRLEGDRLTLRGLVDSDAEDVFAIYRNSEVIRYWSSPAYETVEEARKLIGDTREQFISRTLFEWGVEHRDLGRVIGTCTMLNVDIAHRRAEIGYAFARDHWGAGYGTEAVELLIAFAFGPMNLHRLEADVHPDNAGSLRLLEKQGFVREGHLRERWHHLGRIEDGIYLGLLRPDWLELKGLK